MDNYLNSAGLSKLWNKAKAAFANKTTVEQQLSKKLDIPAGGNVGEVLTKTERGSEWAPVSSGSSQDRVVLFSGKAAFQNGASWVACDASFSTYDKVIVSLTLDSEKVINVPVYKMKTTNNSSFYFGIHYLYNGTNYIGLVSFEVQGSKFRAPGTSVATSRYFHRYMTSANQNSGNVEMDWANGSITKIEGVS